MTKKKNPKEDNNNKEPKRTQSEQANLLSEHKSKQVYNATKQDVVDDLRRVQELFPLKVISRNFYRIHGKYSDSTWNRYFGTFNEFRSGAELQLARDQRKLERQIAKHAALDLYRRFYEEEVRPYHNKYEKRASDDRIKTMVIGSDFHDIEVDPFMLAVFIDTCRTMQPDHIVLNGDIFDNYEFSKYDVDPRKMDILARFNFVKKHIFAPLRAACPDAQIDLIIGNHEWRILTILANKTPAMKVLLADVMGLTLSDVFGLDDYEINLVSKLDLAAFMQRDIKEELKENFKVYYNCFVAAHIRDYGFGMSGTSGHTHRPELKTDANLAMGNISWVTTGCMCDLKAEYVEGPNKWTNGFNIVYIDTETRTVQQQPVLVPGNVAIVNGKYYYRKDAEPLVA